MFSNMNKKNTAQEKCDLEQYIKKIVKREMRYFTTLQIITNVCILICCIRLIIKLSL